MCNYCSCKIVFSNCIGLIIGIGEPNSRLCNDMVEGRWVAWLEAITDIRNKDEIIYDYGWDPACKSVTTAGETPKKKQRKKNKYTKTVTDCATDIPAVKEAAADIAGQEDEGYELKLPATGVTVPPATDPSVFLTDLDLNAPTEFQVGKIDQLPEQRHKKRK